MCSVCLCLELKTKICTHAHTHTLLCTIYTLVDWHPISFNVLLLLNIKTLVVLWFLLCIYWTSCVCFYRSIVLGCYANGGIQLPGEKMRVMGEYWMLYGDTFFNAHLIETYAPQPNDVPDSQDITTVTQCAN